MNQLFSIDNPVMEFISKIFDLIILNLIFIFSCIPIFTIGSSLSAMSFVCLKMIRGEDPYIWQNFWKSFRQNFKQSTTVWIGTLIIVTLLGMDFYIINSADTTIFAIVRVGLWIVSLYLCSMFLYIFPIISHFVCSTKQAVKNAAMMTMGHLPYTVLLLGMHALILYLCTYSTKTLSLVVVISGICGFSVVAFTSCLIFDRVFRTYEPVETEVGRRENEEEIRVSLDVL